MAHINAYGVLTLDWKTLARVADFSGLLDVLSPDEVIALLGGVERIVEIVGVERIIEVFGPDRVMEAILAQIPPGERLAFLDHWLAEIPPAT